MKKLLLLSALFIFACSSDDSDDDTLPAYTMEGKWVFPSDTPGIGEQGISNTMYLFENGIMYTYYCTSELSDDCESLYESFEANDENHLPTTNPYTFEDNVLTIDLHFGSELLTPIIFECNGGEAYFETPGYSLVRLSSGCD